MSSLAKKLYLIKRFGNSLFTYNCANCGKAVLGKCLCEKCSAKLSPTGNYNNGFALFVVVYQSPTKVPLR